MHNKLKMFWQIYSEYVMRREKVTTKKWGKKCKYIQIEQVNFHGNCSSWQCLYSFNSWQWRNCQLRKEIQQV